MPLIAHVLVLVLMPLSIIGCATTSLHNNNQALDVISANERHQARQDHRLQLKTLQAKAANSTLKQSVANEMAHDGLALFNEGYYLDAIDYFDAAAKIQAETGDEPGRAHNLNNLARLYTLVGDHAAARQSLESALSIAERIKSPALQASSLINLGNLELNLRNYQEAATALQHALSLSEPLRCDDLHAEALIVRGAVYRQQSDFEQALADYRQALTIYQRLGRNNEIAASQRVLGELYLHRVEGDKESNLKQANDLLREALAQHQRQGDRLSTAMTLSHLGEYAYATKQYDEAIEHYREALSFFDASGFTDGSGRMYVHLGFAYGDSGELQQAIASFDKAIEIYTPLSDREWQRVAFFGRGLYLENMDRQEVAEQSYKRAVELFESIRADVVGGEAGQMLFTRVNRELYEQLVELLLRTGDVEGALEYVERSRLHALRDSLLGSRSRSRSRGETGIDALKDLSTQHAYVRNQMLTAQDPEVRRRLSETLARNEQEANKLVFKLSQRYRGIENTLDVIPNTRSFRHSDAFPDDLAVITYFATSEALYIFVIKKGSDVMVEKVAIRATDLADAVANAIVLIGSNKDKPFSPASESNTKLVQSLAGLYQVLIAPVESRLVNIRSVAVLPVKWLNYLPFEALMNRSADGRWQFLQQHKQVIYLTSQTYADQTFALRKPVASASGPDIVAFGNPDLGDPKFALPFATAEVTEINRLFPDSVVFVGKQASKKNFTAQWGRHQIVHLAAHARLLKGQAKILLAPGPSGTLGMEELFDLGPNQNTLFVALSACQTAVDPELTQLAWLGDATALSASGPIASVAHTFLLVGIPAVTATLWKIDDQATALLMSDFYRRLKDKHNLYSALRTAQLNMIQRQDRFSQPYYWAAFVYYGL